MKNAEKINLVLNDLRQWADGGDDNHDSMVFALRHGFKLHAASLWLSTGALTESIEAKVKGIKINRKAEMKEIKELISIADIYICKGCGHHSFIDKGDAPVTSCPSCLGTKLEHEAA